MSNPTQSPEPISRAGWRPKTWAAEVGISISQTYELLAEKRIRSVKLGNARIITVSPEEFLASLAVAD